MPVPRATSQEVVLQEQEQLPPLEDVTCEFPNKHYAPGTERPPSYYCDMGETAVGLAWYFNDTTNMFYLRLPDPSHYVNGYHDDGSVAFQGHGIEFTQIRNFFRCVGGSEREREGAGGKTLRACPRGPGGPNAGPDFAAIKPVRSSNRLSLTKQ